MELLMGTEAPIGAGAPAGRTESDAQLAVAAYERPRGTAALIGAGPPAGGTGSPAQAVVAAYGSLAGDGNPHRRGPAS